MSLEPVVAGALVVGLGLWLLERGKEPTHLIWVGVSLICGPWLPLTLYRLALVRRWASSPEVQVVDALGPELASAIAVHGPGPVIAVVLPAVREAVAKLGGHHVDRR